MPEDRYCSECMGDDRAAQIQSHLKKISTEDLEKELTELIAGESDSDDTLDLIDAYVAALEQRPSCEPTISAEDSLQNFHEKYSTLFEAESEQAQRPQKPRRIKIGRIITIAAVIAVMINLLALQVSGINLLGSIAHWTSETFQYLFSGGEVTTETGPEMNEALADLQSELDFHGITANLVPKYLPEGYVQVDFQAEKDGSLFMAVYQHDEDYITIQICKIDNGTGFNLQKDDDLPEIYTVNDRDYSIMTNKGAYTAVWEHSGYECATLNVLSKEELCRMLDSIYEGD